MKKTMWLAAAQLCASFSAEVQTVRRKWIFMVMLVCMLAVAGCKTDGEDRTAAPTENLPEETPLENEEVTPEETLPEETTLEATTPEAATPEITSGLIVATGLLPPTFVRRPISLNGISSKSSATV